MNLEKLLLKSDLNYKKIKNMINDKNTTMDNFIDMLLDEFDTIEKKYEQNKNLKYLKRNFLAIKDICADYNKKKANQIDFYYYLLKYDFFLDNEDTLMELLDEKKITINYKCKIAHRGFSAYYKDNSIKSIYFANKFGADYIEIDIRKHNNSIILCHDNYIKKKNEKIKISDLSSIELQKENIHQLNYILKLYPTTKFMLDIKKYDGDNNDNTIELLYNTIKKSDINFSNFIFASFSTVYLGEIRNFFGDNCKLGYILDYSYNNNNNILNKKVNDAWNILGYYSSKIFNYFTNNIYYTNNIYNHVKDIHQKYNLSHIMVYKKIIDNEFIKHLHKLNLIIFAWTINSYESINNYSIYNLDGIITNYPSRF